MKRNMVLNAFAAACILMPTAFLHAEDKEEPATIRLTHNTLRYNSTKEETKEGAGDTEKTESSGLTTFPQGIEIGVFVKGYSLYAYPESEGLLSFLFGKSLGTNMEAGVSASLNSQKVKDGPEQSYNSIGAYFFYTRPLAAGLNFEFDINPALLMGSSKSTASGVTTDADLSGYSLYFDLLAVLPIAKNFEYVFGLDYTKTKYDVKEKTGAASATTKYNSGDLGLILAKFRYYI